MSLKQGLGWSAIVQRQGPPQAKKIPDRKPFSRIYVIVLVFVRFFPLGCVFPLFLCSTQASRAGSGMPRIVRSLLLPSCLSGPAHASASKRK